MPATWPSQLQTLLNEDSFGFEIGNTSLRTDMDIGPAKVRRRSTKSIDKITGSIDLTISQYSIFYDFFDITTNGGVGTFYFDHPITGVQTEFRFVGEPRVTSIGGGNFRASFVWEIING